MEEQLQNDKQLESGLLEDKITAKERIKKILSLGNAVKNIPFVLYLAVMAVLYIANNGRAVSLVRQIDKKNKELKELKWEYLDVQSRLIEETSESKLSTTNNMGLQPLEKPAFEIRDTIKIVLKD